MVTQLIKVMVLTTRTVGLSSVDHSSGDSVGTDIKEVYMDHRVEESLGYVIEIRTLLLLQQEDLEISVELNSFFLS